MKYGSILGLACMMGLGCQLFQNQRDRPADLQTYAPLPAEISSQTTTPPSSSVTPPGPTGWAENIPSLPEAGIPNVEVRPPSSEMAAGSSVSTGPLREILAEGRKRRMERREERREENVPEPAQPSRPTTPPLPATMPQPIAPPPLPTTMPSLDAPLQAEAAPVADPAQAIIAKSVAQYAKLTDFEAHFIKREVVKGTALPQDEMLYRFRKEPLSVYMKILSDEGKGREVMYVKGQFDNDMHVITGKGDTFLGTGIKTTVEPDSRQAAAKSRRRIYEAGFGRTLTQLQQTRTPIKSPWPSQTPGVDVSA